MTRHALAGGTVLTMDGSGRVFDDGAVMWEADEITFVGPRARAPLAGASIQGCTGQIVLPGFVNAHTHAAQILLRGGPSHSRGLYDWLLKVVIPGLTAYSDEDLGLAIRLYCAEAIRAGVTTIVTNEEPVSADPEREVRTALGEFGRAGLRARYGYMFRDQRPAAVASERGVSTAESLPASSSLAAVFERVGRLSAEYGRASRGLLDVWPSPATTAVVSDAGLRLSAERAAAAGGRWALHLAEIPLEGRLRAASPVQHLAGLGLLGPGLLAAHCVHVDAADIGLLAASRTAVVTNPVSNCYLGSGIAPVIDMAAAGVCVGLGTDDGNCNDSVNPLSDVKTLALLERGLRQDAAGLSPERLMRIATIDGARALGLDSVTGSLEPGKQADLQVIDALQPQLSPTHDPYAALVFQAYGHEVQTVVVAGRTLMSERVLRSEPDLRGLCRDVQRASRAVLDRAGIAPVRFL